MRAVRKSRLYFSKRFLRILWVLRTMLASHSVVLNLEVDRDEGPYRRCPGFIRADLMLHRVSARRQKAASQGPRAEPGGCASAGNRGDGPGVGDRTGRGGSG